MMKFLLDPRAWVVIVIALGVWFVVHTFNENTKLHIKLDDQREEISLLEDRAEALEVGQTIIVQDVKRLDQIAQEKQKVIIREIEIRRELDEIPKTIDTPFADGNNFAYAVRMRNHQTETLANLTRSDDQRDAVSMRP